ncbi:MAG: phosphatidate cytidylyltransferase [Litoreibacter sp.]
MTPKSDKFSDLAVRMTSAGVMAVVGVIVVWAGGLWLIALLAVVTGALVWELSRMLGAASNRSVLLSCVAGISLVVAWTVPSGMGLPFILLPAIAGALLLRGNRTTFMFFAVMIVVASYGLARLRIDFGMLWMMWLILVVIATDVFGYFAGRIVGGPKFWPKVSPKKTWSGTVAGWISAAVVGFWFMQYSGVGFEIVWISVIISMASQAGDIAESAVKRKMGVKDSSNLIPGHGGVFDRFDGMLGAAVFLLLIEQLFAFPPVL